GLPPSLEPQGFDRSTLLARTGEPVIAVPLQRAAATLNGPVDPLGVNSQKPAVLRNTVFTPLVEL
ncbi:hypothetical protein ABTK56_19960, partial [Acinetobacter baumannii]